MYLYIEKYINTMGKKITKEEFIERARKVHGDKYDYSKIEYVNTSTKVCIICPEHGEFWQIPTSHMLGYGCDLCSKNSINKEQFLNKINIVDERLGRKYKYDITGYKNMSLKIPVTCQEHGIFYMNASDLLRGRGCQFCASNQKKEKNDFIEKSNEIYNNKYDYSKVNYINAHTKVCIICPEHGEFWQEPNNHYRFTPKCCRGKSKLEKEVNEILTECGIEFIEQKTFDWLVYKDKMKLDFYIPSLNTIIECQGEQHFEKLRFKNENNNRLKLREDRDIVKYNLCIEHLKPHFIYYTNTKYEYCCGVPMLKTKNELITKIKEIQTEYETNQNN
jgi:hypothetical protein